MSSTPTATGRGLANSRVLPGQQTIITFGEKATFGTIAQHGQEPLRLTVSNGVAWLVETDASKLAGIAAARPSSTDYLVPPKQFGARMPPSAAAGTSVPATADAPLPATTMSAVPPAVAAAASGPVIDLVLGYTPGFAARVGGESQANTRLNYLVDLSNQAYLNSQIGAQLRLLHTVQVSYPDATSNRTALEELTGFRAPSTQTTPSPAFAALRAARDQYGADVVSLMRRFNTPENEGCGIAWLIGGGQSGISASDEYFGYSVVSDGTDVGSDGQTYFCRDESFAHELGHNMGSAHDVESVKNLSGNQDGVLDAGEYGLYPYSFGHRTVAGAGNFYTIMAYGESGQARYRTFSNPRSTYCGGWPCGIENAADNARSLSQAMPMVATFRATRVPIGPAGGTRRTDFDGDGRSDVLWRNVGSQQVDWWLMDGAAFRSVFSQAVASQYEVAATGDFNADGRADILWRDSARTSLWMWMSQGSHFSVIFVGSHPASGWEVVAAGDVDGNGGADILWHNPTLQQLDWWLMQGSVRIGVASKVVASQYRVATTGDFDGDGRVDILWRDVARTTLWMWQGSPAGGFSIALVGSYPPSGWEVVGASDVNADGRSDILWHNPGLQRMDWWLMQGPSRQAVGSKGIANQYQVATVGDFNGDGRCDILWRDAARTSLWIWQADAAGGFSILQFRPHPAAGWEVVGK